MEINPVKEYIKNNDTDIIVYSGVISMDGYHQFCEKIPEKIKRKKNLLLVLCTYGGSPDAGYRIARAAGHYYSPKNFSILIPDVCKSAGTLVCIGANRLIMMDKAELGPLDVQVKKNDEIYDRNSGLDLMRGLQTLQNNAIGTFQRFIRDLNGRDRISTRTAAKIASSLVIGLYAPIVKQIDPLKIGEMDAALQIALAYGERLNQKSESLKVGALANLINGYPNHGFVIDRSEARLLFNKVDKANEIEESIGNMAMAGWVPENQVNVYNLQQNLKETTNESASTNTADTDGKPDGGTDVRVAEKSV